MSDCLEWVYNFHCHCICVLPCSSKGLCLLWNVPYPPYCGRSWMFVKCLASAWLILRVCRSSCTNTKLTCSLFCKLGFGKDMKPWLYRDSSSLTCLCGAGSSQQERAERPGRGYKFMKVFLILFHRAMGIFSWLYRWKRRGDFLRLQKLHEGSSFHDPVVLKIISTEYCSSWKWSSLALIERHRN